MINVCCTKENTVYREFVIDGHAGYDVKGKDIVCAAVSVLFINTFNSIEKLTFDKPEIKKEAGENGEKIIVNLSYDISKQTKLLLDSLMLGFEEIQKEYSDNFSLTIKEV